MTSSGVESAVRPRRFRWSLRTLLIAVAVIAAGLAILSWLPIPRPRPYRDPEIVLFMYTASRVEVFRLAPTPELMDLDDETTHGSYPVAMGPIVLNEDDSNRIHELLLDSTTWDQQEDVAYTTVPNHYEYRIRYMRGSDVLDFDFGWHVTVFHNGGIINGDKCSDTGKDSLYLAIEETISSSSK